MANGVWAVPIIVTTEKKDRNKDKKAFLRTLANTVLYLGNPQSTKKRGKYQLVVERDLQRLTNESFANHGVVANC